MSKKFMLLLALFSLSLNLHAASVWKVSKGNDSIFVGGTIHLLSESDYPLPTEYDNAYKKSDTLVFETDIAVLNTPEFQQQIGPLIFLSDGKTIKDFVSDETLNKLMSHFKERNIPFQNFVNFKPGFLAITLSIIEMQMMGINSAGVDMYYSTKATGDGKQQIWFEEPMEQMSLLADLGKGQEDSMIAYSLEEVKNIRTDLANLMSAWKSGDMKLMEEVAIVEMKSSYPQIYDEILADRNKNWIPKIEALFGNKSTEFVLVGAAHLAGPDSVLTMLSNKGYKVSKL